MLYAVLFAFCLVFSAYDIRDTRNSSCTRGSCIIDYQRRYYFDFSEPKGKVLRRAHRLRDTDGDGVYGAIGREKMKDEL